MHIQNIRRLNRPPTPGGWLPLAKFNLQITPEIVLFDLMLSRSGDGRRHAVFAAVSGNAAAPSASFSPALRAEIITLALDALKENTNDRLRAA